jgi:hypothetical protein
MATNITAQNIIIEGNISDETNIPINDYNISILNKEDSSLILIRRFVSNKFSLEASPSQHLLKISSLGYKEVILPISQIQLSNSSVLDLGTIKLPMAVYNLNEVLVSSKQPFMIMQNGKLVYTVENSIISDAGTVIDLLKRTPYISIDPNDIISVAGRGNTLILINGKQIRSNDEIRLLNSSKVKQIEIIENPSAKYDAEGHAVINIVLKKNKEQGLTSSIYSSYRQGKKGSFYFSPELSYKIDKFRIWGNIGGELNQSSGNNKTWMEYKKENYLFKSYTYDLKRIRKDFNLTYSLGFDYFLNTQNTIGLNFDGSASDGKLNAISNMEIEKNMLQSGILQSNIRNNYRPKQYSTGINYTYENNSGYKMIIIGDATNYSSPEQSGISETNLISDSNYEMQSILNTDYHLYSGKIDMEIPIKSNKIEFGTKYSSISNNNNIDFERLTYNNWIIDSELSNIANYSEKIFSIYSLWSRKYKKWQYSAGIRMEATWIKNISDYIVIYNKNNIHFFPNISISYTDNNNTYRFGYTRRISRPSYSSLTNSVLYIDSLSVRKGNPFLRPTIYNTATFNFYYSPKINASITYSYIESPRDMLFINDKNDIEKYTVIYQNVKDTWMIGVNLGGSFKYKRLTTQPSVSFSHSPVRIIDDNVEYKFVNPRYAARLNSQFEYNKNFTFEANFLFDQPASSYKKFGKQFNFDIGCSQKLFKNRMILQGSLRYDFLPWTQEYRYSYKYCNVEWRGNTFGLSFALSLRYYLKNDNIIIKKKKKSNEEEIQRF